MGWSTIYTFQAGGTGSAGVPGSPGPTGQPGSQILSGVAPPVPDSGRADDYYFQTNGNVWKKTSPFFGVPPAWSVIANIIGPAGKPGARGVPGGQAMGATTWRPSAATQAEMEAATASTSFVTPERAQYHPGASKSWANFNGTGTIATRASHNVSSLTDNGVGDYTINFTTAFSSTSYCGVGNAVLYATTSCQVNFPSGATPGTTAARIATPAVLTTVLTDCDYVMVAFYGDQ